MFIKNKYYNWYFKIIEKARLRGEVNGYSERHHVIPRSLGGATGEEVKLTFREHFLAHWLLTKFTEGRAKRSMLFALTQMCRNNKGRSGRTIASWHYILMKRFATRAFKGRKLSDETKRKLSEINKGNAFNAGKKHTPEARVKIAKARTGFKESEKRREEKRLFMLGNKNLLGHKHSEQTRAKMTESHMARPYKDRAVWLGKKLSEEHKRRISEAGYRRHAYNRMMRKLALRSSRRKQIPNATAQKQ